MKVVGIAPPGALMAEWRDHIQDRPKAADSDQSIADFPLELPIDQRIPRRRGGYLQLPAQLLAELQ